jgi:hypothetical protein
MVINKIAAMAAKIIAMGYRLTLKRIPWVSFSKENNFFMLQFMSFINNLIKQHR